MLGRQSLELCHSLVHDGIQRQLFWDDAKGAGLEPGQVDQLLNQVGQFVGEFVEKKPPNRFRGTRVAREERPLHRFGQVGEREYRPIGVGEVRRERARFLRRERFGGGSGEGHVVGYSIAMSDANGAVCDRFVSEAYLMRI